MMAFKWTVEVQYWCDYYTMGEPVKHFFGNRKAAEAFAAKAKGGPEGDETTAVVIPPSMPKTQKGEPIVWKEW